MKISPYDNASFLLWQCRPAHHGYSSPHHHCHHHGGGAVHRPEHCDHRRDCDDHRERHPGPCDDRPYARKRYDDYLECENTRACDRFDPCERPDHDPCRPARYERPSSCGYAHHDTRSMYDMPKIGDVTRAEFNRVVERAVQTYIIRALTPSGSGIDLFL